MKLHLPKPLLLAVLACYVAPASWANTKNLDGSNAGADFDLTGTWNSDGTFIRAAAETAVTDSIGTLTLESDLTKVVVGGAWDSTGSYFENLTIDTLKVGDGTGNVNLEIGTVQGSNTAASNVVINSVSGNISGLTLDNASSLTINGAPYFATGVALQLKSGTNLILNNAGEITMRTGAAADATDGAIKAQGSGTLTIGSGTTVTFANTGQQKVAPVEGHVVVNGGGVLKLTEAKSQLGYDDGSLDTLTLAGTSADNVAKLDIQTTNNQHLSTDVYMNGNALIAGSNGTIETYNGSITATGVNNKIESKLSLNRALTITVTNADDVLTVSGAVSGNGQITKTGAGTLIFSGTSTFTNGITLSGGDIEIGAAATFGGKSTVAAGSTLTVTSSGQLTFADGSTLELTAADSVLDLSAITYNDNSAAANERLAKLMNQTSGAGTVKLTGGSIIQTTDKHRDNVNLSTNYVVGSGSTDSLTLTAWSTGSWRTWTVLEGGSITVGGGAGMLNVRAGQQLIIENGGIVNVGQLMLGHEAAGNPGSVVMNGKDSQLTVSQFYGNATKGTWNNEVVINGGTLTITGESAFDIKSGSYMDVSIKGGAESPVVLKTSSTDVLMSGDSSSLGDGTFKIANVTIDAANTNTITIQNATLGSGIVNNGKLALGGIITISDEYSYTMVSLRESEGTYSLENDNGFYTASGIQYLLVGGTGTTTLVDGVSATFGGVSTELDVNDSGNVIFTVAGESTTREFFINNGSVAVVGTGDTTSSETGASKYIVGTNGTLKLTGGTLETSIIENNGAVNLSSEDATLVIDSGTDAASYLTQTTGTGTMELKTDVTLPSGGSVVFEGDLVIAEGGSLTLGRGNGVDGGNNTQEYTANFSSLSALNLNGGTLNMYYVAPTIKSMTVETESKIYIDDVWADKQTAKADATRIDSLQLDAKLSMETNWKSNVNIGALTGNGALAVSQKSTDSADSTNLWIDGVNDYIGDISLTGKVALTLNIGAEESLNATQLSVGSGASATLTGSGEYNLGTATGLATGVSLSSDSWTGTVSITGATANGADLSSLGNASSKIAINGLTGWIQRNDVQSLVELGENGLTLTAYSTNNTYNFVEGVSGAGDIILNSTSDADPHFNIGSSGTNGWSGGFVVNNMAANKTVELKMVGGGELMAADGSKGIQMNSDNGTLSFIIGNSGVATTMNGAVSNTGSGTLNMTVQGDTEFKAGVKVSQLLMSGTGVDVTLSGTDNTIGGALSIANSNSLTLAEGSTLNVTGAIENNGVLDISGKINWTLDSTDGVTVTENPDNLNRTTNGFGTVIVSGLITGNGSLTYRGVREATYNGKAASLDTATGLVTTEGQVYYVMNTPTRGENSTELYYSMPNGQHILVDSVVTVGNHSYTSGPLPTEGVNSASAFYVGENGTLCIVGDSDKMTATEILTSTQGSGDVILRAPGYQADREAGGYETFSFEVVGKTQLTGDLYLAPYCISTDADNQAAVMAQSGAYLILQEGADISSFSSVNLSHSETRLVVNGEITKGENAAGHINNLTSLGAAATYLIINQGANNELVLSGDTTVCSYAHISSTEGNDGFEQPSFMNVEFNQSAQITIENLTSGDNAIEDWDASWLTIVSGYYGAYSHDNEINGVVNIESFDYLGTIYLVANVSGSLQVNLNLNEGQTLYDYQYSRATMAKGLQTLTITGEGTYVLSEGNSILSNFGIVSTDFAEDGSHVWTGTVEVNRYADGEVDFADYGNESSYVHFKGYKGTVSGDTANIMPNLILSNSPADEANGVAAMNAYEISGGTEGQVQTYKGSISGDGDFVVNAAENMSFNLEGDVSGWKDGAELKVTQGTQAVNFKGDATEINADVLATGGTMNATIDNAAAVAVNGVVKADGGTLNLSVNTAQGTTFAKEVNVTKLAVGADSTAKLEAASTAGNIKIGSYGEGEVASLSNGLTVENNVVSSGHIADAMISHILQNGTVELTEVKASNLYLYGGSAVEFQSTDTKNQFTFDKQTSYGNERVNEVVFTSDIFSGMVLSEDGAQLTLTVDDAVAWGDAAEADWTNVTIKLNGFTIEKLADTAGVWDWETFGLSISATTQAEVAMLAEAGLDTITAKGLLTADYDFVEYVQNGDGLVIRMYNTPEPTTATLSLLALAALAARRRRRK